jgi:hypothetical protein
MPVSLSARAWNEVMLKAQAECWLAGGITMSQRISAVALLLMLGIACSSQRTAPEPDASNAFTRVAATGVSRLLGRIWKLPTTPHGAAAGAIYVFLPNGTLLETSCVETYRVATWSSDKNDARTLHVVEDQRPVFDATIKASSDNAIQLQQKLAMGGRESRNLTLTAIDKEFVCPDMKK